MSKIFCLLIFLNIFLPILSSQGEHIWEGIFNAAHQMEILPGKKHKNKEHLFLPICGQQEANSDLEIFKDLDKRQHLFDKMAEEISKIPAKTHPKKHKSIKMSEFHDGEENKIEKTLETLQKLGNDQLIKNLHSLMGNMEKAKKILKGEIHSIDRQEFVKKFQANLLSTLNLLAKENGHVDLDSIEPIDADLFTLMKYGGEFVNYRMDDGDKGIGCQKGDREKDEQNRRNAYRLLKTIATFDASLVEMPKSKDGRRRRRRKRQATIAVLFAFILLCVGVAAGICWFVGKRRNGSGGGGSGVEIT